jgi:glycosyltransferase involved in cell wall biosynthesis
VLVGNLDLLGTSLLHHAFESKIPVLHALANATPGYAVTEQPGTPHYWVAPCSDWNGEVFRQAGYTPTRVDTLYPGARIERFFRFFLPDTRRLRLCYASLVLPYKGVDTLVEALLRLHQAGIEFSAEIAGDSPRPEFLVQLQDSVAAAGAQPKIRFTGFLDRHGLSALFARSNVLVFPSRFEEPFGISQVEALAAGLVVVSSGTGGAKEIVRDGVDGLLFPAGDASALAGKLTRLTEDPALFARLQRAGQLRAASFSVETAVRKIESLAEEMMQAIEAEACEPTEAVG